MKIELNIESEEYLYESGILIKAFQNQVKAEQDLKELPFEEKVMQLTIDGLQVKAVCDEYVFSGMAEFPEKKYIKAELKRQIYKVMEALTKTALPWGALTGIRPTKLVMGLLEEDENITDEEIGRFLKENYFVSDEKIALGIEIARQEKKILQHIDYQDGYSLYIGIPFCPTTCLYCSFTSYPIGAYEKKADLYVEALRKEIAYAAKAFQNKKLNSIYFGGGTPTTLTAKQLDVLLTDVREHFDLQYNQEFTVEAGRPDSITEEKLLVLKKHGVTRISINPQTMKQETLDLIGRYHTVEQVKESFALARRLGFDNINMDFIVGLPQEDVSDIEHTMKETVKLAPDSITVHSLALKRAARLNMFKDDYKELSMQNNAQIMDLCSDYARSLDMKPYYMYRQKNIAGNMENVGYAKEDKAGIYNILIMEEKQTIVALGAGASTKAVYPDGRIERCENVKDVNNYIARIDEMIERKRSFFKDFDF